MPTKQQKKTASVKTKARPSARAVKAPARKLAPRPAPAARKAGPAPMTLAAVMAALKAAGSEQTRRTYARHGAAEPMFGVPFGTLFVLMKKIGVDHDLAEALWRTGNFDARNLAMKIADPAKMSPQDLTRWARDTQTRMVVPYVGQLAAENPHAQAVLTTWMATKDPTVRCAGWRLLASIASLDETLPDSWFTGRLAEIERSIHAAPNSEREAMNHAVIATGGRNATLRKQAVAAAGRIGTVEIDHGDTACKTADAASYIKKAWERSASQGFQTPAAHERSRGSMRRRC